MRVFVLSTGRCGSVTFTRACEQITNFTAGHESRVDRIRGRFEYPKGHIEVDPRLSWFLGSLDRIYGDGPLYVHLTRDAEEVARSITRRFEFGNSMIRAFAATMLMRGGIPDDPAERLEIARLHVATLEENITLFLRDKSKVIDASLPDLRPGFDAMWERIGAEGDLKAAHHELQKRHNRSPRK